MESLDAFTEAKGILWELKRFFLWLQILIYLGFACTCLCKSQIFYIILFYTAVGFRLFPSPRFFFFFDIYCILKLWNVLSKLIQLLLCTIQKTGEGERKDKNDPPRCIKCYHSGTNELAKCISHYKSEKKPWRRIQYLYLFQDISGADNQLHYNWKENWQEAGSISKYFSTQRSYGRKN